MAQAPIPSEAQAPAAPAPQGGEAPGGGGKITALMSDTFKNLAMLAELTASGGDQQLAQKVAALKAQFEALVDDGGGAPPAPGGGGPVPMMAGAGNARPAL